MSGAMLKRFSLASERLRAGHFLNTRKLAIFRAGDEKMAELGGHGGRSRT